MGTSEPHLSALSPALPGIVTPLLDAVDRSDSVDPADAVDPAELAEEHDEQLTPLRRQYVALKRRVPDMLLLFQIGDFFEAFDEDAVALSRALNIVLTRKRFGKNDLRPLAGIPLRSLEPQLARLLQQGFKVALCEQRTPPGKGLVQREITRVVTPGTIMEPGLLEGRQNNFLASFVEDLHSATGERGQALGLVGIAWADISTGEFYCASLKRADALHELARLSPAELLLPGSLPEPPLEVRAFSCLDDALLSPKTARHVLRVHFGVQSFDAFGCEHLPQAQRAAVAILQYLRLSQPEALASLTSLKTWQPEQLMRLDPQTLRNLELFEAWDVQGSTRVGSLLGLLDVTLTSMGGRMFRRWLRHPLLDRLELEARLGAVAFFHGRSSLRTQLRTLLQACADVERIVGRAQRRMALPLELVQLAQTLEAVGTLRTVLIRQRVPRVLLEGLDGHEPLLHFLRRALTEQPPSDFERGGVIRAGFSAELDQLRQVLAEGRSFLKAYETRERERTGIKTLRVSYNRVFGYYLEVSRPNLRFVPPDYVRKQTLSTGERFFTLELKEQETLLATASERREELERNLFRQVCETVGQTRGPLEPLARALARLDVLCALAQVAEVHGYVKPTLVDEPVLHILGGRHPMVEARAARTAFVANDTHMDPASMQIMLLTAPNMAGKSVYLRQVALICLLAQVGSFVPAEQAVLGLVDRVFTRVGLHELTVRGQSSFMLEMVETAHILHHATRQSLVVLDEVGRGTATTDGVAIAQAVVEYLHNHPRGPARVLFATHYHELTQLEHLLPRVKNHHLAVEEDGVRLRYLHHILPGKAEKSFGIAVAALAGMPRGVVSRAQALERQAREQAERLEVLAHTYRQPYNETHVQTYTRTHAHALTHTHPHEAGTHPHEAGTEGRTGTAAMAGRSETAENRTYRAQRILSTLETLDVESMSPLEALMQLYELKRLGKGSV
ncbi:MAG: DNA mismatch repair protein MutS [Myxococcota bacterium]